MECYSSWRPSFWTGMLFSLRHTSHILVFFIQSMISSQSLYSSSQLFFSLQHLQSLHYSFDYLLHNASISVSYNFLSRSFRPTPKIFDIYFIQVSAVWLVFFKRFSVLFLFHCDHLRPEKQTSPIAKKGKVVQRIQSVLISLVRQYMTALLIMEIPSNTQIIFRLLSIFRRRLFQLSSLMVNFFRVASASFTISNRCVSLFSQESRPSKKKTQIVSTIVSSSNSQL